MSIDPFAEDPERETLLPWPSWPEPEEDLYREAFAVDQDAPASGEPQEPAA